MIGVEFLGWGRPDGSAGVRNYVAIISTVHCTGPVGPRIANRVENAVAIHHPHCRGGSAQGQKLLFRTLAGLGKNPNVGAVVVVGFGCEGTDAHELADEIAKTGKPVDCVTTRGEGGTLKTIEKGTRIARTMAEEIRSMKRRTFDVSELMVGLKCGGSDATSALAANPALGVACDMLIDAGGTVLFGEAHEALGCARILARRAVNKEVEKRILETIVGQEQKRRRVQTTSRGMSAGNVAGGLTTIEEKGLGSIMKSGSRMIQGVLDYAEKPTKKGLFMTWPIHQPNSDVQELTGFAGAGAQIMAFTTGRGSAVGYVIAPVIKITGNPETFKILKDNMDINAGKILQGKGSVKAVGKRIFDMILEVASGKRPRAEALGHKEFEIAAHGLYEVTRG